MKPPTSTQGKIYYHRIKEAFRFICRIGTSSCFIQQHLPQFLYFHLMLLILLCVNLVFYFIMVYKFTYGIWRDNHFESAQMRNSKVLTELVFLMGINWISEVRGLHRIFVDYSSIFRTDCDFLCWLVCWRALGQSIPCLPQLCQLVYWHLHAHPLLG